MALISSLFVFSENIFRSLYSKSLQAHLLHFSSRCWAGRILTPSHGMNDKKALQTVTVLRSLPQLFYNTLSVLIAIRFVTHSPKNKILLIYYYSVSALTILGYAHRL